MIVSIARILYSLALLLSFLTTAGPSTAAASAQPEACANSTTLTLYRGVPSLGNKPPYGIAPDSPRGPFTISAPLYPGATRVSPFLFPPTAAYTISPYLHTGAAEFQTSAGPGRLASWYKVAFSACGWHVISTMPTGGVERADITFRSNANPNLTIEVSIFEGPTNGAYVAYAAEDLIYPPRPRASYLHGPFAELRIAVMRYRVGTDRSTEDLIHAVVLDRGTIKRLVAAINSLKDHFTVRVTCGGASSCAGPIWLSFVRRNGTAAHVYETMWGPCGGLAANGVRWFIDPGSVWRQVMALTQGRG